MKKEPYTFATYIPTIPMNQVNKIRYDYIQVNMNKPIDKRYIHHHIVEFQFFCDKKMVKIAMVDIKKEQLEQIQYCENKFTVEIDEWGDGYIYKYQEQPVPEV